MVHGDPTRGEVPAIVERRPANAGPGRRSERMRSSRRPDPAVCALDERSLATPRPLSADGRCLPIKKRRGARRNRRAPGASSGGQNDNDGRLRPKMPCCPPGAAIVRSPTVPPPISAPQHQENYLRDLRLTAMSSCLCVFVFATCSAPLRFFPLCSFSVSLCLCGFLADGRQIRNPKSEIPISKFSRPLLREPPA
jgi:hypothetical protein